MEQTPTAATQQQRPRSHGIANWDWTSIGAFVSAAAFGVVGTVNTIRHEFYTSFIAGWNRLPTAFSDLNKQAAEAQQQNLEAYQGGAITADVYRTKIGELAKEHRGKVADRLLKDFNIATDGPEGWLQGTYKRYQHIGTTSRLNAGLGFATTTAIAIGAISLLRHSKGTLDRVEDKLDAMAEQRPR